MNKIYIGSESIDLEPFNKTESNEFIKANVLNNKLSDLEINQIIESSPYFKSESIRPYVLNKMAAYINNSKSFKINDLYNYEEDNFFNDLIKNETNWELLQMCSFFNPDYIAFSTFEKILKMDRDKFKSSVKELANISIIQIQTGAKNGIKLHTTLQEEIKQYSIKKDSDKYAKLLDKCSERIEKINFLELDFNELKQQNLFNRKVYLNLKWFFVKTIRELNQNQDYKLDWYRNFAQYSNRMHIFQDAHEFCEKILHIIEENFNNNLVIKNSEIIFKNDLFLSDLLRESSQILNNLGLHQKALDNLDKSLVIVKNNNNNQDNRIIADILKDIGSTYIRLHNYGLALVNLEKSLEISKKMLFNDFIPIILSDMGELYLQRCLFDKSLEYYNESLINIENDNKKLKAEIKMKIGFLLYKQYKFEDALVNLEDSFKLFENIYDKYNNLHTAGILIYMGYIYFEQFKYLEAIKKFEKALNIQQNDYQMSNHHNIELAINSLGKCYFKLEKYPEALFNFKKSLQILDNLYDTATSCKLNTRIEEIKRFIADCFLKQNQLDEAEKTAFDLEQIGKSYYEHGDYNKAIVNLEKSLELFEIIYSKNDNAVCSIIETTAVCYSKIKNNDKALAYLNRLVVMKNVSNEFKVSALNNIANIYVSERNNREALVTYEKLIEFLRTIDDRVTIPTYLNRMGRIYSELGEYYESVAKYEETLALALSFNEINNETIASIYENMAFVYGLNSQYEEALFNFKQSLEFHVDNERIEHVLKKISKCYYDMNDYDNAIDYGKRGLGVLKKILTNEKDPRILAKLEFINFIQLISFFTNINVNELN
jgi:tetratricopeptide (TPR) repeat protein